MKMSGRQGHISHRLICIRCIIVAGAVTVAPLAVKSLELRRVIPLPTYVLLIPLIYTLHKPSYVLSVSIIWLDSVGVIRVFACKLGVVAGTATLAVA